MTADVTLRDSVDWRLRPWQKASPRAAFAADTTAQAQGLVAAIRGTARRFDRRDGDSGPSGMPFAAFSERLRSRYEPGLETHRRAEPPASDAHDGSVPHALLQDFGAEPSRPRAQAPSTQLPAVASDIDDMSTAPVREPASYRPVMAPASAARMRPGLEAGRRALGDGDVGDRVQRSEPAGRRTARRSSAATMVPTQAETLDADLQGQLSKIERGSFGVVSHRLKSFVGDLLSLRVPNVKLYDNPAADRFARRFDADAVTYGDKILFRTGKFRPQEPGGLALLAHELTHAAGGGERRQIGGPSNPEQAEERTALLNESTVLHQAASLERPETGPAQHAVLQAGLPQPRPMVPVVQPRTPVPDDAALPKAAQSGRDIGPPPQEVFAARPSTEAQPLSPQQLNQVYDYLKDKVREEGERIGV